MKKQFRKLSLIICLIILFPEITKAIGWETFVPDLAVIACFDASSEEMKKAVDRDNTLNTYMGRVLDMEQNYQIITYDLIDHARYAYGNREDGSFSVITAIEANPMSSLKQFKNFYKLISSTIDYYTRLTGYLCNGDFSSPLQKAQTIECLLTQGYDTYVILEEYWKLRKEDLSQGRIIERDILWYMDVANNLNQRLSRINNKLYAQVRMVRSQKMTEKQDMHEWIRKRADEKVQDSIKDIIG